jgi:hypothetical protein
VIGSGAYIYDGINIMKLKVSFFTMKEKLAIRVALLLSFLVLVTKGKTIRNKPLENIRFELSSDINFRNIYGV